MKARKVSIRPIEEFRNEIRERPLRIFKELGNYPVSSGNYPDCKFNPRKPGQPSTGGLGLTKKWAIEKATEKWIEKKRKKAKGKS